MTASRGGPGLPVIVLAAVVLIQAAAAPGQDARDSAIWSHAPERFMLATGIPCVYQKDAASPTTAVGLVIGGGRSAVPAALDGLAAISTRLLLEIPDDGKVRELMAQATRLSYACLEDHSVVLVECLSEHLQQAVHTASRIIQDPLISSLRVGRAKDLMAANMKAERDDAVAAARAAAFRAFFGGRGYGSAPFGTEAGLEAIARKDVFAYVRRVLVRPNVLFVVETDLEKDAIRELLEKSFDALPDGEAPGAPLQEPALPEEPRVRLERESRQTYVGRAFAVPRAGLTDMARGYLLETLLGKGPGSRLWPLRTDERLAYNVETDLTWTRGAGLVIAYLEAGRAKAAEAGAALDRVLEILAREGVPQAEMEATRTMARARFLRGLETKSPRLRTLGLFEILAPGAGGLSGFYEALGAVTRDDLNAFIHKILDPSRALALTVGPEGPKYPQGGDSWPR
ncbi:MAG: insulinase family protein [Candidatus Aminicenantes bacterium]|nr:insulinase family protein [Candidatus Aminicenantes bacterium]